MIARLVDFLDDLGHRIGWCPAWLCDLQDYMITGEWPK